MAVPGCRVLAAEVLVAADGDALGRVLPPGHGWSGREQGDVGRRDRVGHLLERADVVDDPDAPAVRPDDEVVVARVHEDVVDPHGRQPGHERLPLLAAVQRDVASRTRCRGTAGSRFFGSSRTTFTFPIGRLPRHGRPRSAVVLREEDVRLVVVGAVPVEHDVARARVEVRRLDPRHEGLVGHALHVLDDVLPGCAAVAADLEVAVVGAGPDDAGQDGRFGHRRDDAGGRHAVVLGRHRRVTGDAHDRPREPAEVAREIRRHRERTRRGRAT